MALKEMYILQKAWKKTQTHKHIYESEIVLVTQLVLLTHLAGFTIRKMKGNNTTFLQSFILTDNVLS